MPSHRLVVDVIPEEMPSPATTCNSSSRSDCSSNSALEDITNELPPLNCADSTPDATSPAPRSPVVLKVRRTNHPHPVSQPQVSPFKITLNQRSFGNHDDRDGDARVSSSSLAASILLVSPLRPLTRRTRASLDETEKTYLFASQIRHPMRMQSDKDLDERWRNSQFATRTRPLSPPKPQSTKRRRWLIPAEHPYKIAWDVLTFTLSFANAYSTHAAVRDRQFGTSWFTTFCEVWFLMDILLNFVTEYKSDEYTLRHYRGVWARYLTTWFVVDLLSLFPGETLYVKPLIDMQNRRGFFKKTFFRSKAVVRVTRILRGRHFKLFGRVASHTKHAGIGAARLLQLLIKYIPKYLLYFRNMKGVVALRLLRQVHWFRKVYRTMLRKDPEEARANNHSRQPTRRRSITSNRDMEDDDEDGTPY